MNPGGVSANGGGFSLLLVFQPRGPPSLAEGFERLFDFLPGLLAVARVLGFLKVLIAFSTAHCSAIDVAATIIPWPFENAA